MSFVSPVPTDANGQPRDTGNMQSLGKDDFLRLLVAKLQYQDPLEPMADEDFIAQLAEFSSLEQMYNISEGIASSNQWDFLQMQSINNSLASNLIGKEVEANYEGIYVDAGVSPKISYTLDNDATNITLSIRDATGAVVATLSENDVAAGSGSITWDGTDTFGNRVADGYYTVDATATAANGNSLTPKLGLVGIVSAITYRDGSAYLNVNGVEIPLGDVRSVRDPELSSDTGTDSGDDPDEGTV